MSSSNEPRAIFHVRNLLIISLVCANEIAENKIGIVNAEVNAFPDQRFTEADKRALSQIVGAGLESKSQHADSFSPALDYEINRALDLQLIALRHTGEERRFNIERFGLIE